MEVKLNILKPFFDNPDKLFYIREVARIVNINHTTVRLYLNEFVKEEILSLNKDGIYPCYKLSIVKKTLNLKLYYNLENIRESGLVEYIERELNYPTVILFGSYSKALDNEHSDIDICIITNIKKMLNMTKYEKKLKKIISIKSYTKDEFNISKSKNKEMINNICNGIVLSGQLRVL